MPSSPHSSYMRPDKFFDEIEPALKFYAKANGYHILSPEPSTRLLTRQQPFREYLREYLIRITHHAYAGKTVRIDVTAASQEEGKPATPKKAASIPITGHIQTHNIETIIAALDKARKEIGDNYQ